MFKIFQEKWNSHNYGFPYSDSIIGSTNFAGASIASHALTCLEPDAFLLSEWIIDTWTFDHMTPSCHLFCKSRALKQLVLVTLPSGNTKSISIVGPIKLNPSITLHHVSLVSKCKYNLLLVSKLLHT